MCCPIPMSPDALFDTVSLHSHSAGLASTCLGIQCIAAASDIVPSQEMPIVLAVSQSDFKQYNPPFRRIHLGIWLFGTVFNFFHLLVQIRYLFPLSLRPTLFYEQFLLIHYYESYIKRSPRSTDYFLDDRLYDAAYSASKNMFYYSLLCCSHAVSSHLLLCSPLQQ